MEIQATTNQKVSWIMALGFMNTVPEENRFLSIKTRWRYINLQLNISRVREFFSISFCKGAPVNLDSLKKKNASIAKEKVISFSKIGLETYENSLYRKPVS